MIGRYGMSTLVPLRIVPLTLNPLRWIRYISGYIWPNVGSHDRNLVDLNDGALLGLVCGDWIRAMIVDTINKLIW